MNFVKIGSVKAVLVLVSISNLYPYFDIYCPIWMKFGVTDTHVTLYFGYVCKRSYTDVCTVKLRDILKLQVKPGHCVTECTTRSFVKHFTRHVTFRARIYTVFNDDSELYSLAQCLCLPLHLHCGLLTST
jgi:hypothetical protein